MTLDQMNEIIEEIMLPCWPDIAEGGKHEWTTTIRHEIIYPAVRRFRASNAAEGARRLARKRKTSPTAQMWADETKAARGEAGTVGNRPAKVDCEDCRGCGILSFSAERDMEDDARPILPATIRHYLEPMLPGAYSIAIPCHCPNAPKSAAPVNADIRRMVITRIAEFEVAHGLRGHDEPASSESIKAILAQLKAGGPQPVGSLDERTAPIVGDDPNDPPF